VGATTMAVMENAKGTAWLDPSGVRTLAATESGAGATALREPLGPGYYRRALRAGWCRHGFLHHRSLAYASGAVFRRR